MTKRATRRAKRLLDEAAPHVGADVIIIAPGCNGQGYFATSMSTRSAQDLEATMTLVNEALKKLRRWHRRRVAEQRTDAEIPA